MDMSAQHMRLESPSDTVRSQQGRERGKREGRGKGKGRERKVLEEDENHGILYVHLSANKRQVERRIFGKFSLEASSVIYLMMAIT